MSQVSIFKKCRTCGWHMPNPCINCSAEMFSKEEVERYKNMILRIKKDNEDALIKYLKEKNQQQCDGQRDQYVNDSALEGI